ncbi:MAG TPA: type II secretion system protein [Burkholderiales bacterium]|nr:type II secretion system protein [Burkholderiales bacterium]
MTRAAANTDTTTRTTGFTLIELIVVISITGIIAAVLVVVISGPFQGYESQSRRAELVDAAESALRRMQRDIRHALPNSIRIDGTGQVLEMLNTVAGGRYRHTPTTACATANTLIFTGNDTTFDMIGTLGQIVPAGSRIAIYNLGQPGGDAYADGAGAANPGVITPAGVAVCTPGNAPCGTNACGNDRFTIPAHRFSFQSPSQRFYVVNTPVTYLCNAGNVTRFAGYALAAAQPTVATNPPLSAATSNSLVTSHVTGCLFTYTPGTSTRAGLVTASITVRDPHSTETINLLHQIHVFNTP